MSTSKTAVTFGLAARSPRTVMAVVGDPELLTWAVVEGSHLLETASTQANLPAAHTTLDAVATRVRQEHADLEVVQLKENRLTVSCVAGRASRVIPMRVLSKHIVKCLAGTSALEGDDLSAMAVALCPGLGETGDLLLEIAVLTACAVSLSPTKKSQASRSDLAVAWRGQVPASEDVAEALVLLVGGDSLLEVMASGRGGGER